VQPYPIIQKALISAAPRIRAFFRPETVFIVTHAAHPYSPAVRQVAASAISQLCELFFKKLLTNKKI
jgi:hypothetical protein